MSAEVEVNEERELLTKSIQLYLPLADIRALKEVSFLLVQSVCSPQPEEVAKRGRRKIDVVVDGKRYKSVKAIARDYGVSYHRLSNLYLVRNLDIKEAIHLAKE